MSVTVTRLCLVALRDSSSVEKVVAGTSVIKSSRREEKLTVANN